MKGRRGIDIAIVPRESLGRMMKTRLTLAPGANGTKKLVERYGTRLVCVRYRYDDVRRRRIKTVELVEEETAWTPPAALYLVKIPYEDTFLRAAVKSSGGRWNAEKKAWLVTRTAVRDLRLDDRVIGVVPSGRGDHVVVIHNPSRPEISALQRGFSPFALFTLAAGCSIVWGSVRIMLL